MSKLQHEAEEVKVKYRLDESSKSSARMLEIRQFREAVLKEAERLKEHKVRRAGR